MAIGVIGGSGLKGLEGFVLEDEALVETPFGDPSAPFLIGRLSDLQVVFLSRHGKAHSIPPHRVNYRANMWGFKELGVKKIISVNSVGGINRAYVPGDMVVLNQVIDMTSGARASTFFDDGRVVHIDLTEPYCPELRQAILAGSQAAGIPVHELGTYVCVNGPRLETAAEIQFFSMIGADVVGMTAMPEAALARELELCMAAVAVVTNLAAGLSVSRLTASEVVDKMRESLKLVGGLLQDSLRAIPAGRSCFCRDSLREAGM